MVKYEGHKVKVNATVQVSFKHLTVESGQFVLNLRAFLVWYLDLMEYFRAVLGNFRHN